MTSVLTVSELARELRVGRNQAYQLVASGAVFSVRIGRSLRIPRASLETWLSGSDPEKEIAAARSLAAATPSDPTEREVRRASGIAP